MKLPRPHIPLSVRIAVAERQLHDIDHPFASAAIAGFEAARGAGRLKALLHFLRYILGAIHLQLDHDPALALRRYDPRFKDIASRYFPNANNPDYLIYRAKDAHRTKTFLRGEHGQRSDVAQIKRERRRARPKKPKRAWPKARKLQGRPFQKRRKP